ncbi:MAG: HEAT repeat domain-containing protein [Rhodomicrobium sp.]
MDSEEFKRFRFSFFDDPDSARQGLDKQALAALEGDEWDRAEEMLLDYLPDTRGVIGLGTLRSQRAEPVLRRMLEMERGSEYRFGVVDLSRALWQIRPDPRWLAAVIEVLGSASSPWERMDAAQALYVFHDSAAVPALVTALDDSEPLVRHHAARALLAIHGLSHSSISPQDKLYRVMSDDAVRKEGGKQEILAAIAGRQIAAP